LVSKFIQLIYRNRIVVVVTSNTHLFSIIVYWVYKLEPDKIWFNSTSADRVLLFHWLWTRRNVSLYQDCHCHCVIIVLAIKQLLCKWFWTFEHWRRSCDFKYHCL